MNARLQVRAAQLFPNSPTMQAKWITARQAANRITPHFAQLMPLTTEQLPPRVLAPRTEREAFQ